MIDLAGKPIAITGASAGIGRATAIACARAGMPVAMMARRWDKLVEVQGEIESFGGRATVFEGSVDSHEANAAFVRTAEKAFGPVFAVFANAGYGFERATLDTSDEELRQIFETNFWGTLSLVRAAAPGMLDRRHGHILICSSCVSKIGLPMYGPYSATKAAQDHIGRAMRHEYRDTGVSVSTVHPVGTKTEFFDEAKKRSGGKLDLMGSAPQAALQSPDKVARVIVRRLGVDRGGEIWSSFSMPLLMGVAAAAPGLADMALGWMVERRFARSK